MVGICCSDVRFMMISSFLPCRIGLISVGGSVGIKAVRLLMCWVSPWLRRYRFSWLLPIHQTVVQSSSGMIEAGRRCSESLDRLAELIMRLERQLRPSGQIWDNLAMNIQIWTRRIPRDPMGGPARTRNTTWSLWLAEERRNRNGTRSQTTQDKNIDSKSHPRGLGKRH